jgi:hypothetical protein
MNSSLYRFAGEGAAAGGRGEGFGYKNHIYRRLQLFLYQKLWMIWVENEGKKSAPKAFCGFLTNDLFVSTCYLIG